MSSPNTSYRREVEEDMPFARASPGLSPQPAGIHPTLSTILIDPAAAFEAHPPSTLKPHPSHNNNTHDDLSLSAALQLEHGSSRSFCSRPRQYQLSWLSFFLLGTINNISFVVINSAAKSLADSFDKGNLIGAIVWCNVAFGIGCKFLNTFYLLQTSYVVRMIACCLLLVIGMCSVAFGTFFSFWFCLFGVVLVGSFSALGESVLLGFLKSFDPLLMGAWSSGTGMAGVGGTSMYLLMYSILGWSNRLIFFLQAPFVIVYYLAFRYVNRGVPDPSKSEEAQEKMEEAIRKTKIKEKKKKLKREQRDAGEKQQKQTNKKWRNNNAHSVSHLNPFTADASTSSTVSLDSPHAGRNLLANEASPDTYTEHGVEFEIDQDENSNGEEQTGLKQNGVKESDLDEDDVDDEEHSLALPAPPLPHRKLSSTSINNSLSSSSAVYDETMQVHDVNYRETSFARTMRVTRTIFSPAAQLTAVYFLEYSVSVGFASKANPNPPANNWWLTNSYELLAFAYQVGVLIARSSVSIYQIRRIEFLTLLQAAHFVLWLIQAMHPFLPLWLQLIDMAFVGLLGGAMYVNVFYLLIESDSLNERDKELGINLTAIGVNLGIVASSIAEIVLFTTIMKGSDS